MALNNTDPQPLAITIYFDGLDTERNELLIESFNSPDLINVSFDTIAVAESRLGSDVLCPVYSEGTDPDETVPSPIMVLSRHTDSGSGGLLIGVSENGAWQGRTGAVLPTVMTNEERILAPLVFDGERISGTQAVFVDESASYTDATQWDFYGACMYITGKGMRPMIHLGGSEPTLTVVPRNITELRTIYPIRISFDGTHSIPDGSVVRITNLQAADFIAATGSSEWYDYLQGNDFYATAIDPITIELYDKNMEPTGSPDVGVGIVTPSGNVSWAEENTQCVPWPRGRYSTTVPVRGWPQRWLDLNGDLAPNAWPYRTEFTPDWPKYTEYVGVGPGSRADNALSARLLAYGFEGDPDRIDYSALGAPYNFLKDDPSTGDTEAAAETNPELDGGYFYASRGDGDRVIGVREHMGFLVVFKQRKIIVFSGEIGQFFRVEKVYSVGAVSNESIIRVGNELYFYSLDGPRKLSVTDAYSDLLQGMVGQIVLEQVRGATPAYLKNVTGRHERLSRRIIWNYTDSGTWNNKSLVYYYPEGGRETWSLFDGYYSQVQYLAEYVNLSTNEQQFFFTSGDGTYQALRAGYVYELNKGTSDTLAGSVTADIPFRYVTRWFDAGDPLTVVRALEMTVLVSEKGSLGAKFYVAWDYSEDWHEMNTAIRPYSGETGRWSFGTWNAGFWNTSQRSMLSLRGRGRGRIFRIKIEADAAPIGISGLILNVSRKGTR